MEQGSRAGVSRPLARTVGGFIPGAASVIATRPRPGAKLKIFPDLSKENSASSVCINRARQHWTESRMQWNEQTILMTPRSAMPGLETSDGRQDERWVGQETPADSASAGRWKGQGGAETEDRNPPASRVRRNFFQRTGLILLGRLISGRRTPLRLPRRVRACAASSQNGRLSTEVNLKSKQ
jgi:hypothetical protein